MEDIRVKIQNYIEKNMIDEAEELILKFKDEFKFDEFASMACIISIYKGKLEQAEEYIRQGLKYNLYSSDLYCNMGFIYELKQEFNRSYLCYEHALEYANEELKKYILGMMNSLKENYNITVNPYSIIILTYNNIKYTKDCINSIRKFNQCDDFEIIVVDNNSTDGTREWIKEQSDIQYILNNENKGFPAGCNQGIEKACKRNDIFLLNNDTLIMENSIFNLRMALYSSDRVGATGPVSNSCPNYQEITQKFNSLEEYERFALNNNISNEQLYEKRIKLIGFAMMIKREVLNEVGLLDERFTPGNYEDDDLSYRILKSNHELILCLDSYIHHFGGTSFKKLSDNYIKLLNTNSEKFKDKWGFYSGDNSVIKFYFISRIMKNINDKFKLLEIGCNCGATLLSIKNIYKNAELYGIENNRECADVCRHFINIESLDIEQEKLPYKENYFDYIIINDTLEEVKDPKYILDNLKRYLKEDGEIIAAVSNIMHVSIFRKLLLGEWNYERTGILKDTHIRFFTSKEIANLIKECEFKNINIKSVTTNISDEEKQLLIALSKISSCNDAESQFMSYKYVISAQK